jgi:peptide deformylase
LSELLFYPDERLDARCKDVVDLTAFNNKVIPELERALYGIKGGGQRLAVAAPQVGHSLRAFAISSDNAEYTVIINPKIVDHSDDMVAYPEGCLSIPTFFWKVWRPESVTIEYTTIYGNTDTVEADKLVGRIIQHEMNHLDGLLLPDFLDDDMFRRFCNFYFSHSRRKVREMKGDVYIPLDDHLVTS